MSANFNFVISISGLVLCCVSRGMPEPLREESKQTGNLQSEFNTLKKYITETGQSSNQASVTGQLDRMETLISMLRLKDDINNIGKDQDDVKKDLMKRVQAMEEKVERCMADGYEGVHPFGARLSQIEKLLMVQFRDFTPPVDTDQVKERKVHRSCKAALADGWKISGVYRIRPNGTTEMDVYCDQVLDGGGWIVFQRRLDGSEDFYRNWADYKAGFGDLSGEFWLGNDNLHLLTKGCEHQLKFELLSPGGEYAYADYARFYVDDETKNYKVHVEDFSGAIPPGNSFDVNGMEFSTKDRDNDLYSGNCAVQFYGGWWYNNCFRSNLNGLYGNTTRAIGMNWITWAGYTEPMSSTKMMIRRKI